MSNITKTTAKQSASSPLAEALQSIQKRSAELRSASSAQETRVSEFLALQKEAEDVKTKTNNEEIDFSTGSARLAKLDDDLKLLSFTKLKRAESLVSQYANLRDKGLQLKVAIITAIGQAESSVITKRQREVAALMEAWGGDKGTLEAPVSLACLASTCPTLKRLDQHRSAVLNWSPNDGVAALVSVAEPAIEFVDKIPSEPAQAPLYGGFSQNSLTTIRAWNGITRELQTVGEFYEPAAATDFWQKVIGKPNWLGSAQLVKFDESNPVNTHNYGLEIYQRDYDANGQGFLSRDLTGENEGFFREVETYTA